MYWGNSYIVLGGLLHNYILRNSYMYWRTTTYTGGGPLYLLGNKCMQWRITTCSVLVREATVCTGNSYL